MESDRFNVDGAKNSSPQMLLVLQLVLDELQTARTDTLHHSLDLARNNEVKKFRQEELTMKNLAFGMSVLVGSRPSDAWSDYGSL